MASDWDNLTLDEPEAPRQPQHRGVNRQPAKPRSNEIVRTPKRSPKPKDSVLINENTIRPRDVSEDVWGLVEQWWDQGREALGTNPRIIRPEFARTLRDRIRNDPDVRRLIAKRKAEALPEITRILSTMTVRFWKSLAEEDNAYNVQLKYWADWDQLWYDAVTSIEVADLNKALSDGRASLKPRNYKIYVPDESRKVRRLAQASKKVDESTPDRDREKDRENVKRLRDLIAKRREEQNPATISD